MLGVLWRLLDRRDFDVEHVTAEETRATGPQWTFAPCICAARDDRWGRTYESDPARRKEIDALVAAWLPGSEGAGVADPLFGGGRTPASCR